MGLLAPFDVMRVNFRWEIDRVTQRMAGPGAYLYMFYPQNPTNEV
jgi:hypothetical protein